MADSGGDNRIGVGSWIPVTVGEPLEGERSLLEGLCPHVIPGDSEAAALP